MKHPANKNINYTFLSALTLAVPTIIAVFNQPVVFTVILTNATLWSVLYHYSKETQYQSLDEIWANLVIIIAGTLMVLTMPMYPVYHWRIILPTILGALGVFIFLTRGYVPLGERPSNIEEYEFWHSIWHILATLTILILVTSKYDIRTIKDSYYKIVKSTWKRTLK